MHGRSCGPRAEPRLNRLPPYGRPPIHTRFKKGVCPNPKGRGKRDSTELGKVATGELTADDAIARRCSHPP